MTRRYCACWPRLDQHESAEVSALHLARVLKRVRPELDLYLLSNGRVEEIAGDPRANAVRRVFYAVEEMLELHLAILEGVQDRYDTPFFNNLKKYAQRPSGLFTRYRSRVANRFSSPIGFATWVSSTAHAFPGREQCHHRRAGQPLGADR